MQADGRGASGTSRVAVVAPGEPGATDAGAWDAPDESVPDESALDTALATSRLISKAKGLLMERHGLDAEEAFALLRQYSRSRHLPIRDGAGQLVRHEEVS